MTKFTVIFSAFLFSASVFAATPDFSAFDHGNDPSQGGPSKIGQCMMTAWDATSPTAEQNSQAKGFCDGMKSVFDAHKDALKADMKAMMEAWSKYPIAQSDVVKAETALGGEFMPIHNSFRDGQISILNLLTADQRKAFDHSFMDCMHHDGDSDGAPVFGLR